VLVFAGFFSVSSAAAAAAAGFLLHIPSSQHLR
jgi:hypothetical protein